MTGRNRGSPERETKTLQGVQSPEKKLLDFLQSHCIILYSQLQCMRVLVALDPGQHLLFSVFLVLAILVSLYYYVVAFICISMVANVEPFSCILTFHISSL